MTCQQNIARKALILAAFWLSSCALMAPQEAEVCASTDWYEIGRQDGAKGLDEDHLEVRLKSCSLNQKDRVAQLYLTGRNVGLVDYCSPTNAFNLGRSGQSYTQVCPGPVEREFLREYRRGQRVFELEQANRQLDQRIGSLSQELEGALPSSGRNELADQINELRQTRQVNERELRGLTR